MGDAEGKPEPAQGEAPPAPPGAPLGAGRGETKQAEGRVGAPSASAGQGVLASGLFQWAFRGSRGATEQGETAGARSGVWRGREERRGGEE